MYVLREMIDPLNLIWLIPA